MEAEATIIELSKALCEARRGQQTWLANHIEERNRLIEMKRKHALLRCAADERLRLHRQALASLRDIKAELRTGDGWRHPATKRDQLVTSIQRLISALSMYAHDQQPTEAP